MTLTARKARSRRSAKAAAVGDMGDYGELLRPDAPAIRVELVGPRRWSFSEVYRRPFGKWEKCCKLSCMFLDWTNWTFWVTALALVAFGFCLRDIYEQLRFRKVRQGVRSEFRDVEDL